MMLRGKRYRAGVELHIRTLDSGIWNLINVFDDSSCDEGR
jgi:hypothetical protein